MPVFHDIQVPLGGNLEARLRALDPQMVSYRILKQSLDARHKEKITVIYQVETVPSLAIAPPDVSVPKLAVPRARMPLVTIIGAGPAGLFAALRLLDRGVPCRILERGKRVDLRLKDIARFWRYGVLDPDSNVCFGEGGAGTFSDGKLITRIKSEHIDYVKAALVRFGAPEAVRYLANPHVGSNRIRRVIRALCDYLMEQGCDIQFQTAVSEFRWGDRSLESVRDRSGTDWKSDLWILATGHSARDIYDGLFAGGVAVEPKSLAVGLRIEHPQAWVNRTQYGKAWPHPDLPVATYKLTCQLPPAAPDVAEAIGVYSFCMCPGGYVLSSGTEADGVVVNGMSNYHRNAPFANAAVVVTVDWKTWFPQGPQAGLAWQRAIEKAAFLAVREAGGSREVPVQRVSDFLANRLGSALPASCPSGVRPVNLRAVMPAPLVSALEAALCRFDHKMPGFAGESAQLYGVETRTSSPVRIVRDPETLQSRSHPNLYPVGEGAGYAGGITSAAVDGIRAAEAIVSCLTS